ncbi:uncharacterized protein LOC132195711 isoform X2 [Neocloeon triangulifer]|uniref:uncharacterized protein LOC132195711 isoform X2 n=1 Tax=Neocloeon triangulifer TaxID=2078957 RepID=UPI00286ECD80|nr:uncharacterized protein LOC132195711 isoform X2 [Neocloeon triangulifer]
MLFLDNFDLLLLLILHIFCNVQGTNLHNLTLCPVDETKCQECKSNPFKCYCNSTKRDTNLTCHNRKLILYDGRSGGLICPREILPECKDTCGKNITFGDCGCPDCVAAIRKKTCQSFLERDLEPAISGHRGPKDCPSDLSKCHNCTKDLDYCFCPALNKTIKIVCSPYGNFLDLFNPQSGLPHCPPVRLASTNCSSSPRDGKRAWCRSLGFAPETTTTTATTSSTTTTTKQIFTEVETSPTTKSTIQASPQPTTTEPVNPRDSPIKGVMLVATLVLMGVALLALCVLIGLLMKAIREARMVKVASDAQQGDIAESTL